jgi:hypothetical protein
MLGEEIKRRKFIAALGVASAAGSGCLGSLTGTNDSRLSQYATVLSPPNNNYSTFSFFMLSAIDGEGRAQSIGTLPEGATSAHPTVVQPGFVSQVAWQEIMPLISEEYAVFNLILPTALNIDYQDEIEGSDTDLIASGSNGIVCEGDYNTDELSGALESNGFTEITDSDANDYLIYRGGGTSVEFGVSENAVIFSDSAGSADTVSDQLQRLINVVEGEFDSADTDQPTTLTSALEATDRGDTVSGLLSYNPNGITVPTTVRTTSDAESAYLALLRASRDAGNVGAVVTRMQDLSDQIGISISINYMNDVSPSASILNEFPQDDGPGAEDTTVEISEEDSSLLIEATIE